MFNFGQKIGQMVDNENLEKQIENLEKEVKRLENLLANQNNENWNATAIFDFEKMNVFSIERNFGVGSNQYPRTVVGYLLRDATGEHQIREWYYFCSVEQHEKLAAAFQEYLDRKQTNVK